MKALITLFAFVASLVLSVSTISNAQQETETVSSIILPPGFSAEPFYIGIPNPDGIAFRDDGSLLVVNEAEPQGVFIARRGDTFDIGDAFSTTGPPFVSPDGMVLYPDGSVFVADGQAHVIFKISAGGGAPKAFVTPETIKTVSFFSPWSIAIAPPLFKGPHVNPGDLIIAVGTGRDKLRAVWAINPSTGAGRVIARDSVFLGFPTQVEFSHDSRLFVYQNYAWETNTGSNRIVCLDAEGKVTPFLTYIPDGGGMTINPVTGDIYFGLQWNVREIWWIPSEGGYPRVFASDFQGRLQDMVFSPDGRTLFVSHPNIVIEITGPFLEPKTSLKIALGSIAGNVTNTKENTPYSDLTIVAHDGDKLVSSAQTDEQGKYQLMLLPGEYTIRPKRDQVIKSSDELVLTVSAGQESKADFTVTPIKLP